MDNVVASTAEAQTGAAANRGAPSQVTCLVPIWGFSYVRRFLTVALPTWLSPGNLPAVASELPAEMVILTAREDEAYLRAHPAFRRLTEVLPVRLHFIDHLITGSNYSVTITLAYAEAVRASAAMLDTGFIFLVGDYIVADGSFGYIARRMKSGLSGIQVGNFQVAEEDAAPWLQAQPEVTPGVKALKPRHLVSWGLSHLHPATVANTVNFGALRNVHTNRLFWRVDGRTLIGRFFLMHMICIRPETADFVVGSSCDYSFIPEMCPSGNVEIITDSDQYLVIEMQPRAHETQFLRPGPHVPALLATSLSEWTTERHRRNADTTIIFHGDALPDNLNATVAKADDFLAQVARRMVPTPRPYRNHPYWEGAIASFREAIGAGLTSDEQLFVQGYIQFGHGRQAAVQRLIGRAFGWLIGKPPHPTRWHPRWADHEILLRALRRGFDETRPGARMLLVSDSPTVVTTGIPNGRDMIQRMRTTRLLAGNEGRFAPLSRHFDVCLVELSETDLALAGRIVERVELMVRDSGLLIVSVMPRSYTGDLSRLNRNFTALLAGLMRPSARSLEFECVPVNVFRRLSNAGVTRLFARARESRSFRLVVAPLLGLPLLILGWFGNVMTSVRRDEVPSGPISSALITIVIDSERALDSRAYSKGTPRARLDDSRSQAPAAPREDPDLSGFELSPVPTSSPAPEGALAVMQPPSSIGDIDMPQATHDGDAETREPQYNRCLDLKARYGLTSLGLMTNQVWEDDPRRLAILLSRYKFVAKMLSGRKFAGELGCGDAFGTRIVLQEVERVVVYDFDPVFIEDIRSRPSERWPLEAHVHDILRGVLPYQHDAIYSLDVMEHISSADEDRYLRNLRDSLTDNGVLIIGSPSLELQAHASPPSKVGHINCKSGAELKALLRQYFENVFLFSMNDEVVHTGFYPMAHYLFAVCTERKEVDEARE